MMNRHFRASPLRKRLALASLAALLFTSTASGTEAQVTQILDYPYFGLGGLEIPIPKVRDVVVDESGNAFVAGGFFIEGKVLRIPPRGEITVVLDADGDGAGNTYFDPGGLALDGAGNLYAVGVGSRNIFKITPDGVITQLIGPGQGWGDLSPLIPAAVDVDAAGNVYFAAGHLGTEGGAFKLTPAGEITQILDASGDGAGNPMKLGTDIVVDGEGNAYVTSWLFDTPSRVFQIAPTGAVTAIIDGEGDGLGGQLVGASYIAVDSAGDVYVTGSGSSNAFKVADPAGANVVTQIIDTSGDGAGHPLGSAKGIAVDRDGNVYIAGGATNNAFKVRPNGEITQFIDGRGDGDGNSLVNAGQVATGPDGSVYVTGTLSGNAFRVAMEHSESEVAGLEIYGCGINPAGSISVLSGRPTLGSTLVVGIDNPVGSQAAGAVPFLAFSALPSSGSACGGLIDHYGMIEPFSGELLLGASPFLVLAGAPWEGPDRPAPIRVTFPDDANLTGVALHAQGVLFDPTPGAVARFGLTEGLRIELGRR
jgi:sugar lactone lactonase YvrE